MKLTSVIEIGSNSVKLLAARVSDGAMEDVIEKVVITRLSEDMSDGFIKKAPLLRTVKAIKSLSAFAKRSGSSSPFVFATAALRDAKNKTEALAEIKKATGFVVDVVCGKSEAKLSRMGATMGLSPAEAKNAAVVDVGGRTTELSIPPFFICAPTGAVKLKEELKLGERPDVDGLYAAMEAAGKILRRHAGRPARTRKSWNLIGVGGTFTTLARTMGRSIEVPVAIEYKDLSRMAVKLAVTNRKGREDIFGVDPGRSDIIVEGAAIALAAAEMLNVSKVVVSACGARHGYLLRSTKF